MRTLTAEDIELMRFRHWEIKCPVCGHTDAVLMSLRRLRQASFKCTTCGKSAIKVVEIESV